MTEHIDEYDDESYDDPFYVIEDEDLRADVDALRQQVEAEAEVNQVNRDIQAFSSRHGLRLSPGDWQSMGELIDAGHDPESAYTELQGADFEDRFLETVAKVERQQGRSLLDAEVQRLWEASVRESDAEHVDQAAILNPDKDSDRAALIDGMLAGDQPDPEPVAPLAADASDADRAAYTSARLAGAEVESSEDTF